jgi:hypothetical protein
MGPALGHPDWPTAKCIRVELELGRRLEAVTCTPFGLTPEHDGLIVRVLTGRVHRLQDDHHASILHYNRS